MSNVFETSKGKHTWHERTICEVHRELYDRWFLKQYDQMLPLMEEAYTMGIKLVKKLVEYKLSLPEWQKNTEETRQLRELRNELSARL